MEINSTKFGSRYFGVSRIVYVCIRYMLSETEVLNRYENTDAKAKSK